MKSTRLTLLIRLRDGEDESAWREFEEAYRDLLLRYCRRRGLQPADAEDAVQLVFTGLAQALPRFVLDPARGRFRDYLFRCTRNGIFRWSQRPGRDASQLDSDTGTALEGGEVDPAEAAHWDEEWIAHHYRTALARVRTMLEPASVEIFDRSLGGATVEDLARAFGVTASAVYKARQRVRARLEELIVEQVRAEDDLDERAI